MRSKILLTASLLLFAVSVATANDPIWLQKMKQIAILSDDRHDVIKKMGAPVDGDTENHLWYYDFDQGRMSVMYETGVCGSFEGKPVGWRVPEWKVAEVRFSLDENILPKKLGVNFTGFTVSAISDDPNGKEYMDDDLGIDYTVFSGKIHSVTFRPSNKFNYLLCR